MTTTPRSAGNLIGSAAMPNRSSQPADVGAVRAEDQRSIGGPASPPVLVFLPGMSDRAYNTSTRIAEIISAELTAGPGTFSVGTLDSDASTLSDGRRIVAEDGTPVLDLFTVDYRDKLPVVAAAEESGSVLALARMLLRQTLYFVTALGLFLGAGRRAKTNLAKWQLVAGFAAVTVLSLAVVITIVAVLVALGVIEGADVNDTFDDAFAIGATAATTWVLARATPKIRAAAGLVQRLLDYARHQQQAVTVVNCLGDGLDALLDQQDDREIHILGYSLGALVALDYLCPRTSQLEEMDGRHASAIRGLITIGCPMDFVRLYLPAYTERRTTRVPDLRWTNVFIPADVLGSNMLDGDDGSAPEQETAIAVGSMRPTANHRYTDEVLTWRGIWGRRGFLSHGGYWTEPRHGNCLHVVITTVLPHVRV